MATTPEGKTKQMIKRVLTEFGAYYAMPIGSGYGNAGVPDFLVCHKGWFIAIEAKAGKGKTTALQDAHLERISDAGGIPLVIYEDAEDHLRAVMTSVDNIEVMYGKKTQNK